MQHEVQSGSRAGQQQLTGWLDSDSAVSLFGALGAPSGIIPVRECRAHPGFCRQELPEQNAEQLTQVHVVWSLFKAQATAVVQVHGKLCWEALHTFTADCESEVLRFSGLKSQNTWFHFQV